MVHEFISRSVSFLPSKGASQSKFDGNRALKDSNLRFSSKTQFFQDDTTFTLVSDCLNFFIILLKIRCKALLMEMSIHVGPNLFLNATWDSDIVHEVSIKHNIIGPFQRWLVRSTQFRDLVLGLTKAIVTTFHTETFQQELGPPYIKPRNGLIFS